MKLNNRISILTSGADGIGMNCGADATVYLINGGSEYALIDAGFGDTVADIIEEIRRDGYDPRLVKKIFITHGHADHAGGAASLSKQLGAEVYAMESTANAMQMGDMDFLSISAAKKAGMFPDSYQFCRCDVTPLCDYESVKVGDLNVIPIVAEGHCDGHLVYNVKIDGKNILFSGDAIFYHGKISVLATADTNIKKYVQTINRLAEIEVEALFPAHGCFTLTGGHMHIMKAKKRIDKLEMPKNYNEDLD